jgi:hypothetical protein
MTRIEDSICEALKLLPVKPPDSANQADKKRYSELVSQKLAVAIADELRNRGLDEARPAGEGDLGDSGAERRMAGGLGAKKVDVTWATEEAGLLFAISIKSINFRDKKTNNFQKNLTNRRGDMLMEAVTLHRRFPYAVLSGFFFLDKGAETDSTKKPDGSPKRRSTLENAHMRLKLFTGRDDPAGREEQFERFYLMLLDASPQQASVRAFAVGAPAKEIPLDDIFNDLLKLVAERNPDFYEYFEGSLRRAT